MSEDQPPYKTRRKGARGKLREHFLNNIGRVMDSDELREVAGGITEWARRVRELRSEEGYEILTHNDRSDLKSNQYLLENPKPRPAFERAISSRVRSHVLDRNGFTCQMCGAAAGDPHPSDPSRRTRLHIGHIKDKSQGGTDDASNLRALCSVCNEGASNITLAKADWLAVAAQIRRANGDVQLQALEWLIRKYPNEAKRLIDGG